MHLIKMAANGTSCPFWHDVTGQCPDAWTTREAHNCKQRHASLMQMCRCNLYIVMMANPGGQAHMRMQALPCHHDAGLASRQSSVRQLDSWANAVNSRHDRQQADLQRMTAGRDLLWEPSANRSWHIGCLTCMEWPDMNSCAHSSCALTGVQAHLASFDLEPEQEEDNVCGHGKAFSKQHQQQGLVHHSQWLPQVCHESDVLVVAWFEGVSKFDLALGDVLLDILLNLQTSKMIIGNAWASIH